MVKKSTTNGISDPNLENKRTKVTLTNSGVENARGTYYSGAYTSVGYDNSFKLDRFKENFKINILSESANELVFEMIGIDAPIANALRRIMISEIPTMAIEKVYIINNTSILQDEVLAHRLGMIPIKVDPRKFNFKLPNKEYTAEDTLIFQLKVKCEKDAVTGKIINETAFSKHLIWVPTQDQEEMFPNEEDRPRPMEDDIPIMKLRPGQVIDIQCYCEKNIGREHIKWSPVCTASYRLQPVISVDKSIKGEKAKELLEKCPKKVFDIEDSGQVVAARPLDCTMCRECIRDPEFEQNVKIERVRDHFIFSIESTGALKSREIFQEAIKIFIEKCNIVEESINKLVN
ncbi:hypothetical protein ACTA71_008708 [Dictyostelium dimigraforme]